jgi:hypothetical protein
MLAGIIFQMSRFHASCPATFMLKPKIATITIYVVCAIEFFVRYLKKRPIRAVPLNIVDGKRTSIRGYMDKRLKIMSIALSFSTVCLFIR